MRADLYRSGPHAGVTSLCDGCQRPGLQGRTSTALGHTLVLPFYRGGNSPSYLWVKLTEVLDVEAAFSRPFLGDAGILTRVPAVELRPQVFCSRTLHCGGAHGRRRTALALVVVG